jgi:hypothetical protein
MPGLGRRFYFVEKVPLAFSVFLSLLFANTFLMLLPEFPRKYVFPRGAPEAVVWYENHSIAIQFVLLALLGLVVAIYRKRIEFVQRNR